MTDGINSLHGYVVFCIDDAIMMMETGISSYCGDGCDDCDNESTGRRDGSTWRYYVKHAQLTPPRPRGIPYRCTVVLLAFFFASSAITRIGEHLKDIDDEHKAGGQRDWKQVPHAPDDRDESL